MKIEFIQKIIDKIRRKPNFTLILLQKFEGFKKLNDVKTLILGSSHLQNNYIAVEGEYNFAISSQDLYYGYNLYKKLNNPSLKNIVIAFSVFTPGLSIIKTQCADFCIPYKVLFDIDYQDFDVAEEKQLFKLEDNIKKEIEMYLSKDVVSKQYRGNLVWYPHKKFNAQKARERALKHYKNNQRENNQMNFCVNLLNDTCANGQKIYFVLPPVTKSYREALPEKDIVFKDLYNLVKDYDHAKILDYYDTDYFDERADFTNEDHLNKKGAQKLSTLIRRDING